MKTTNENKIWMHVPSRSHVEIKSSYSLGFRYRQLELENSSPKADISIENAYKLIDKCNPRTKSIWRGMVIDIGHSHYSGEIPLEQWQDFTIFWHRHYYSECPIVMVQSRKTESGIITSILSLPIYENKLNRSHYLGGRGKLCAAQTELVYIVNLMNPEWGLNRGHAGGYQHHSKYTDLPIRETNASEKLKKSAEIRINEGNVANKRYSAAHHRWQSAQKKRETLNAHIMAAEKSLAELQTKIDNT